MIGPRGAFLRVAHEAPAAPSPPPSHAAAQEVLKATGKFTPIDQWVHHDEGALVADACPSNVGPLFGSRYDHQIAVLGKDFQARIANQRVFLVGCGALGCEYLKGLALMGAGTGKDGRVWVRRPAEERRSRARARYGPWLATTHAAALAPLL